MSLRICPSCSRHAREALCPFCGAAIAQVPAVSLPRAARTALIGAVAAAAVTSACSATALYGGPMPDASPPDAAQNDAGNDAMATFYGGPPIDSGTKDSGSD